MEFELESGVHEENKRQIKKGKSKAIILFKISPPLFHYTTLLFRCKCFSKLMAPNLTQAEGGFLMSAQICSKSQIYIFFEDFRISLGVFCVYRYSTFLKYEVELNPKLSLTSSTDLSVVVRISTAFSQRIF